MIKETNMVMQSNEWHGCKVRVSIELPQDLAKDVLQYQYYADANMLHDLYALPRRPPIEGPNSPYWADWMHAREQRERIVNQVASQIAHAFSDALRKGDGE